MAYSGLWLLCFMSATLLPMASEGVLLAMLWSGNYSPTGLWLVASSGNSLGSISTYALGRYAMRYQTRRWWPVSPQAMAKAQKHYLRYGYWTLMLSWLPLIGDALCLVAGLMREPWWRAISLIAAAKTLRYLALLSLS